MATRPIAGEARPGTSEGERRPLTLYDLEAPADRRRALRRVPRLTREAVGLAWQAGRRNVIGTAVLQVITGFAVAFQLLIAREILTDLVAISEGGAASAVYPDFALLVVITGVIGGIGALLANQQQILVELVANLAFERIVGVATTVDLGSLETPDFHDQLQRARVSGSFRAVDMVTSLTTLSTAVVTSAGIALVLAFIQPLLLVFVVVAAIPMLVAAVYNSRARHAFEYAMTPESRERAYLLELFTGREAAKELRVLGSAPVLRQRYIALTDERLRRLREFLRRRLVVALTGTTASAVGSALGLGALVFLLVQGQIDVASAVTAGLAMQQLSARFASITGSTARLIESSMFIEDYNRFLALVDEQEVDETTTGARPHRTKAFDGVAVENVSFAYPSTGEGVLHDVSLEIRPGETVALVGENGSGKTTLVKLICQLYRPKSGRILWNGIDTSSLPSGEIQDDITVLFQDFIKYQLPVVDNIALGRAERDALSADVEQAARRAGAADFVSRLPLGYDTRLGLEFYGGHELSVGQWQRLALARAFFRDGGLIVMDEPTASLDPRAERDLFAQMAQLWAGRAVLLISHRFSSVRSADRIYVMEQGAIIEAGSHDELIAADGLYSELFNLQAAAYLGESR